MLDLVSDSRRLLGRRTFVTAYLLHRRPTLVEHGGARRSREGIQDYIVILKQQGNSETYTIKVYIINLETGADHCRLDLNDSRRSTVF